MVVVGTLPYLSACTGLLKGSELLLARHQIRLIIGCLKALGDIWKKGQSRVRELRAIGKEIIGGRNLPAPERWDTAVTSCGTYVPCPLYTTSEPLFNPDTSASARGGHEDVDLWPEVNAQLDINTWITNNFGPQFSQNEGHN